MWTEKTPVRSALLSRPGKLSRLMAQSAGFEPTGRKKQGWLGRVTLAVDGLCACNLCGLLFDFHVTSERGQISNHHELLL